MKVGDYARLQNSLYGTIVIYKIMEILENTILTENDGSIYEGEYSKEEIIKSSPNIIDLIEVGDYVNGMQVTRICFDEDGERILNLSNCILELMDEDIKSIVTKEQFESMEYKIGE